MNSLEKELVQQIFQYCTKNNITIRVAESCTGGSLSSLFTSLPGSSNIFDRGVVTYSNKAKEELLSIASEVLDRYGAVSYEIATLMVENLIQQKQNILGLAITGILGPASDNTKKPVGLVYIAVHYQNQTTVKKLSLSGNRDSIKSQVLLATLQLCLDKIQDL